MNVRHLSLSLMAYTAGSIVLLSASAAGAAVVHTHHHGASHGTKAPVIRTAPPHTATLPYGYTVVTNESTVYAGSQSAGAATCPGTEQPVGGGAFVSSNDLSVNINSSYPDGQSWAVDINNASALDSTYYTYAVCMNHSRYYRVVKSAATTAYSEWVSSKAVTCPKGTAVMGGGAYSTSPALDVYINSAVPNQLNYGRTAWRVAMASADPYNTTFTVYATCEPKLAGYSIQWGQPVANGPYSQNEATVTCPGASVPIGGGGFMTDFQNQDAWIGMNTSFPGGSSWSIYENNYENVNRYIEAAAICAGT
jgi:hypothetical protein